VSHSNEKLHTTVQAEQFLIDICCTAADTMFLFVTCSVSDWHMWLSKCCFSNKKN